MIAVARSVCPADLSISTGPAGASHRLQLRAVHVLEWRINTSVQVVTSTDRLPISPEDGYFSRRSSWTLTRSKRSSLEVVFSFPRSGRARTQMTSLVPREPYSAEELAQLYPKDLKLQLVQVVCSMDAH